MLSLKFLFGVAVGATAMALLDPDSGHGRRARLADQMKARARRAREEADRRAHHEAGVDAREAAMEAGAGVFTPTDDRTLADHLHEVLARLDVPTEKVNLKVVGDLVRLRGRVEAAEHIDRIVEAVSRELGVHEVECYLHLPGDAPPTKEAAMAASARAMRSSIMR